MADEKSPVDEDVTKDTADASEPEDDPSSDKDITSDDAPNDGDTVEPGEVDDEAVSYTHLTLPTNREV